jgi:hypothetical protein
MDKKLHAMNGLRKKNEEQTYERNYQKLSKIIIMSATVLISELLYVICSKPPNQINCTVYFLPAIRRKRTMKHNQQGAKVSQSPNVYQTRQQYFRVGLFFETMVDQSQGLCKLSSAKLLPRLLGSQPP